MPESQQGLLGLFSLDILYEQSVLYVEHRHNQIKASHTSKLLNIQRRRNNGTCPAFGAYDNTVLPAYASATLAVKINVVVGVVNIPELPQSQICKILYCSIPNYRQGPRACKNFLFCFLHFFNSGQPALLWRFAQLTEPP